MHRRHVIRFPSQLEKPISWRATSYQDLCAFPEGARRDAGFQLGLVQAGHDPDDWKPMPIVGPGTIEIRIRDGGAFRVFVLARFAEAVYVLHAFGKTSRATPLHDVKLAQQR